MTLKNRLSRRIALLAIAVCLFFPVGAFPQSLSYEAYEDPEGYTVLSVLLNQTQGRNAQVHIYFLTVSIANLSSLDIDKCAAVPDDFKSAFADFRERNQHRQRLLRRFSLSANYELVEESKGQQEISLPPAPGEQEMRIMGQDTLMTVSAIGFDKTRTHAIAYIQGICGPECAGGGVHLLAKGKAGWKEIKDSPTCTWMS
jgi:hypothetical protein